MFLLTNTVVFKPKNVKKLISRFRDQPEGLDRVPVQDPGDGRLQHLLRLHPRLALYPVLIQVGQALNVFF